MQHAWAILASDDKQMGAAHGLQPCGMNYIEPRDAALQGSTAEPSLQCSEKGRDSQHGVSYASQLLVPVVSHMMRWWVRGLLHTAKIDQLARHQKACPAYASHKQRLQQWADRELHPATRRRRPPKGTVMVVVSAALQTGDAALIQGSAGHTCQRAPLLLMEWCP